MCKNDLKLNVLPVVLQDLVLMYAYNGKKEQIMESLECILNIIGMKLPFFFLKERIWSWQHRTFLPNPCITFLPMEYYGKYHDIFDDDAMYCLLLGLDFRRRSVRRFGSREHWMSRICSSWSGSWRAVEALSSYYKMLLRTKVEIMKKRGPLVMKFI